MTVEDAVIASTLLRLTSSLSPYQKSARSEDDAHQ